MATESIAPTVSAQLPKTPRRAINNIEFIRALARALLALAASAIILIAAYITFSPGLAVYREVAGGHNIQPRTIHGGDLTVRLGAGGKARDKTLHLAGLSQDGRAIVTRFISLKASDYPFVEYTIKKLHPGAIVYLIWKTAENPENVSRARLHASGNEVTTLGLANDNHWEGSITELGFDIYGDLRDEALIISSLRVLPYSPAVLLATIWSEWTTFEAWDQTSINRLRGVPSSAILSPSVAMAAWAGLALLCLGVFSLVTKAHNPVAYLAVIFIPWIALDLFWQDRLSMQLTETKFLFQGKSQHERHLADMDSDLYRYAQHIKSEVLPDPDARVFLLHDNEGERHNYRRLRTQFHLLPHNIYNYGSFPPRKYVRDGDYILTLGAIKGLNVQASQNLMSWGKNNRLTVDVVDEHPLGNLYQVRRDKAG